MNSRKYLAKIFTIAALIILLAFAASAQSGRGAKEKGNGDAAQGEKPVESGVVIVKKVPPRVEVFDECFRAYRLARVQTRLRVTFEASGEIGAIEIVGYSGCAEFDQESIRVARLIEFKPAVRDGAPLGSTEQILYLGGIRPR